MSKTSEILQEFVDQIDTEKEFALKELKQILTDIYKAKNSKATKQPKIAAAYQSSDDSDDEKPKKRGRPKKVNLDKDGNIKEKKPPTAYNNYVKEQLRQVKEQQAEGTPAKEVMKLVAANWKALTKQEQESYKS
jgi:hypothetical protein